MAKDDFATDIAEWCNNTKEWAAAECAKKTRRLFYRVIDLSPHIGYGFYSRGHFILNWRAGPTPQVGEVPGEISVEMKNRELQSIFDDEYFIYNEKATLTNSTPYVFRVEYTGWPKNEGDGHGPYSPVATALSESL